MNENSIKSLDINKQIGINDRVKLINGRFVDVVNGCYFKPEVSVIVQNGEILAMPGLQTESDLINADYTVNLQGKTVIPGLFNTHCHLQLIYGFLKKGEIREHQIAKNLKDCLECGITNIRDAWAPNLQGNRDIIDKIKSSKIPGPRIYQSVVISPAEGYCTPKLNLFNRMIFPFVNYDKETSGSVEIKPDASKQDVRDAVNCAIDERGADYIKFYDQPEKFMTYKPGGNILTDIQLEAAVDQACSRGIQSTIHQTKAASFRRAVKAGVTSLAHLPSDELLTEADVTQFLASDCYIEPTLSVSFGYLWSSLNRALKDVSEILELEEFRGKNFNRILEESWLPEIVNKYRKQYERFNKGNFKVLGVFEFSTPYRRNTNSMLTRQENMRFLCSNDCISRIGCGNDATASFYSQASISLELDLLQLCLNRGGNVVVDAANLLRIATIQSARAMKVEEKFGSIKIGKTADLVVLDGDPLTNYHLIGSRAMAVFMNGKLVINNCGLKLESSRFN